MRISDWSSDVCSSDLSKDLSPISKRSSSCVLRLNTTLTALFTRWRRSPIKKTSETYRELRVGQSHIRFPPNEEPLASLASPSSSSGLPRCPPSRALSLLLFAAWLFHTPPFIPTLQSSPHNSVPSIPSPFLPPSPPSHLPFP